MNSVWFRAISVLMLCFCSWQVLAQNGWDNYKSRFIVPEGRVIDTANNNVSHSEGQGFAMLLAVDNDDRQSFDKLWLWTQRYLYNADNGLFWWRYDPSSTPPVVDKNNASDGDTLIAWALLRAGIKWQEKRYLQRSEKIQRAIIAHNVTDFAGYRVMLPGVSGFKKSGFVVLNPSYFIFPAWRDFASHGAAAVWNKLINDGMDLLSKMAFGQPRLPTDWVKLKLNGTLSPADGWPPRFGYDAVRIPLYVWWYDPHNGRLMPFYRYWQNTPRLQTPAWLDVISGKSANYTMSGGLLAIRDLIMADNAATVDKPAVNEDYYSASLRLLTLMAQHSFPTGSVP